MSKYKDKETQRAEKYMKVSALSENSKVSVPVDINISTKDEPDRHGIGVARVKEIFDKYDGKVKFEQEEDRFVVKGFLNCKNWCQGIA